MNFYFWKLLLHAYLLLHPPECVSGIWNWSSELSESVFGVLRCNDEARPFPEADTGFRQSQASLIWQELEEDEEGQREASLRSLFRPGFRGRRARTRLEEEEEEEGRRGHSHRRRDGISDYCDGERLRYFIMGTVAAVLALLFNLIYPLLYWSNWAWFTTHCSCRPSVQRFAL